ncbi:hypothetical protein ACU4GD_15200 [Cupriavidus basilensis]
MGVSGKFLRETMYKEIIERFIQAQKAARAAYAAAAAFEREQLPGLEPLPVRRIGA